jgi:hypothetical protein
MKDECTNTQTYNFPALTLEQLQPEGHTTCPDNATDAHSEDFPRQGPAPTIQKCYIRLSAFRFPQIGKKQPTKIKKMVLF